MNICMVGPTHPFRGGIAHYTSVLYRELSRSHNVSLVSLRSQYPNFLFPGTTQLDNSRQGIAVPNDPLLSPVNPFTWHISARAIARRNPDLVLFQWWQPFFGPSFGTVARLLRRWGFPSAFLCHNVQAHESSSLDGILSLYALKASASYLVHSHVDSQQLKRWIPSAVVEVAPHPRYDMFKRSACSSKADAREHLGLPDVQILLFFGNIRKYKGLPILLRALDAARRQRPIHLVVAGEFYHGRQEVQELIRELNLERSVTIVDRYVPNEEVSKFFAATDAVVLPYLSASQSGVAQVAYSFGIPVIATEVGGLPEVVEDGTTGLLVPPEDPGALSDAIVHFFEQGMAGQMSVNILGRSHYFSWQRMVEAITRLVPVSAHGPDEETSGETSRALKRAA